MTDLYLIYKNLASGVMLTELKEIGLKIVSVRISLSPPLFLCYFSKLSEIKENAAASDPELNGPKRVNWGWSDLPMIYGVDQQVMGAVR